MQSGKDNSSIFPLWDIEITGEFRKKVPAVRKNDQPAKAQIPRVKFKEIKQEPEIEPDPFISSKRCEFCGEIFFKQITCSEETWEQRKFCSVPCYRESKPKSQFTDQSVSAIDDTATANSKKCEFCGNVFFKPARYNNKYWASRRFCSLFCSSRNRVLHLKAKPKKTEDVRVKKQRDLNPKDFPSKTCVICGATFYRTRFHKDEQWEKLAICTSIICRAKLGASSRKRSGPIAKKFPPRECIICGRIFEKPYAECAAAREKHLTCSAPCFREYLSLRAIEDAAEPDTIDISPRIKMSDLSLSIPDIVLVELQKNALENNVSTSDVAMVAIIEYLLRVNSDNTTIKTSIKRFFKKPDVKPKE